MLMFMQNVNISAAVWVSRVGSAPHSPDIPPEDSSALMSAVLQLLTHLFSAKNGSVDGGAVHPFRIPPDTVLPLGNVSLPRLLPGWNSWFLVSSLSVSAVSLCGHKLKSQSAGGE